MDRSELIAKCRYYKGEPEPPEGVDADFWFYERYWVDFMLETPQTIENMLSEYKSFGLGNFEAYDGTPITLKALLCNRYLHGFGPYVGVEEFKTFYKKDYVKGR